MARTTVTVPDHIRDILKQAPIKEVGGAWHLELTMQLSRPDYEATNKVIMLAGGKWNRSAKAHVFATDPRPVLLGAVEAGQIVDKKKVLQAYYTPRALAERVVDMANLDAAHKILEPECGNGGIAGVIAERLGFWPDCVDLDPDACSIVTKAGATRVWNADFLTWAASTAERYDRIVMNPPFTGGQDIAHVTAAMFLLKPGGRLTAIMSPHWTFADDKASALFRSALGVRAVDRAEIQAGEWDSGTGHAWLKNEDGAFSESGTGVSTGVLVYTAGDEVNVTIDPEAVAKGTRKMKMVVSALPEPASVPAGNIAPRVRTYPKSCRK